MSKKKIAVIVGSFRTGSLNRQLANALAKLGSDRFEVTFCRIDDLPLFWQDIENDPPPQVNRLKDEINAAQGVLLVTPEYNRSIPAAMKNALDWGNRPASRNCWTDKPVAVAGATKGKIGTACAQQVLRQTMMPAGALLMGLPTLYFTYTDGIFDEDFNVTDEDTRKFFDNFLNTFDAWIDKVG
jgi:chromate reductase